MQLSKKQQTFSTFFSSSLKSILNFKYFQQKDEPHGFCIFEITDSEHSEKSCFRGHFEKHYGKRVQALLQSSSQYLYHIHWSLAKKLS